MNRRITSGIISWILFCFLLLFSGCDDFGLKNEAIPPSPPDIYPEEGEHQGWIKAIITSSSYENAVVYYTTDGTDPDLNSPMVTGPVEIRESTTLKAAAAYGSTLSEVVACSYLISPFTPAPVLSPAGKNYHDTLEVELAGVAEAEIYYGLDSTAVTPENGTLYTGSPIILDNEDFSITAIAVRGGVVSEPVTETYTWEETVLSDQSMRGRWLGPGETESWAIGETNVSADGIGYTIREAGSDYIKSSWYSSGGYFLENPNLIRLEHSNTSWPLDFFLYRQSPSPWTGSFTVTDSSGLLGATETISVTVESRLDITEPWIFNVTPGEVINLEGIVPWEIYYIQVTTGDIAESFRNTFLPLVEGQDWGTIDLAGMLSDKPEVRFYLSQSSELHLADRSTSYGYLIRFDNYGGANLEDASWSLSLPEGITLVEGEVGGTLGDLGFHPLTYDDSIDFRLTCAPGTSGWMEKELGISVSGSGSSSSWSARFPLVFYTPPYPVVLRAEAESETLSGLLIDPDGLPLRLVYGANTLEYKAGTWLVALGGRGEGTATKYALSLGSEIDVDYDSLVSTSFGEPNNREEQAVSLSFGETALQFLDEYDLDYYTFELPSLEEFIAATVSFDGNGAEGGIVPDDLTGSAGIEMVLPGNSGDLVKGGYNFTGWSPEPPDSSVWTIDGIVDAITPDRGVTTLHAAWIAETVSLAGPFVLRYDGSLWKTGGEGAELLLTDVTPPLVSWNDPVAGGMIVVAETPSGFQRSFNLGSFQSIAGAGSPEQAMESSDIGFPPTAYERGYGYALALNDAGNLYGRGSNGSGQLGLDPGTLSSSVEFTQVLVGTEVTKVACGYDHSLAVSSDGGLWVFGTNGSGQYGDGTTDSSLLPVNVRSGVADVYAMGRLSFYFDTGGALWASGENGSGRLGVAAASPVLTPLKVMDNAAVVVSNGETTLFIKSDGTLWGSGANGEGQLGIGHRDDISTPVFIMTGADEACWDPEGERFLIRRTDGSLWTCEDYPRLLSR